MRTDGLVKKNIAYSKINQYLSNLSILPTKMNFITTQDPKEQMREVQRKMREEQRRIDREIREIAREEAKVKLEIKNLAKRGGYDTAIRSLAKELVGSKKAVAKLYMAKTQLNSISMQLRSQV